jgi:tetratricopeptide (TPR) repeat protein
MINRRCIFVTLVLSVGVAAGVAQNAPEFSALAKRADAARDAGKVDEAVGLYHKALRIKPDWRQGWWSLGSLLYDANRYREGEAAFVPLTKLDPDKSPGWAMAGLCEFEIEHYRDALRNLERADKLGLPATLYDVNQYHIILILIRAGQFDAAIEAIAHTASRGAENPKLVQAMGMAALRRAILPAQIAAGDQDLIMALGQAMCDAAASHGKEATAEFESIMANYPSTPQLHYLYGMVLLQSDSDKALAEFDKELAISPNHTQSLISIAAEHMKRAEYAAALLYAEKAVVSDSSYFATHAMLGKVLVEGNLDVVRGANELEAAVKLAPGNPQSRLALAAAYAKMGRKDEAAKQRKEFLRLRTQMDASAAESK